MYVQPGFWECNQEGLLEDCGQVGVVGRVGRQRAEGTRLEERQRKTEAIGTEYDKESIRPCASASLRELPIMLRSLESTAARRDEM